MITLPAAPFAITLRAPISRLTCTGAEHSKRSKVPRPPNVPPLRALQSLSDGICGLLKGSWGVLVVVNLVLF